MNFNHPQLQKLPEKLQGEVFDFSHIVQEYMKRTAQKIFDVCGLYIVGSSLSSDSPNDVDIVLVGLDFREIFNYGGIYLRNPRTLIDEEIIVPKGDSNAAWGEDKHNTIIHEGREFRWNENQSTYYNSIGTYCDSNIEISPLVDGLHRASGGGRVNNPIHPYRYREGSYLVVRQKIGENIDFLIHGEGMLVDSWKENQGITNLCFFPLYEGNKVAIQTTQERPQRKFINLPCFIDPYGKKRSSYIPGE